jgi:D-apionolactonase
MIRNIKLNGKRNAVKAARLLATGDIRLIYEAGSLRYISAGGIEIIRMINFAVRDKDWLTVSPDLSDEKIQKKKNGFEISYNASYRYKEIDFQAAISIVCTSANRLIVEMKGSASSTFLKNRIGFCILHPIVNCAGHDCEIIHPDGTSAKSKFPEEISPHQPFKGIQAMRWTITDSLKGKLSFEGDIFETEDQRNWTDASFKTYSTPLDQPFPVEIARGTALFQRVEFTLEDDDYSNVLEPMRSVKPLHPEVIFHVGNQVAGKLPDIGVGSSSRPQPVNSNESGILKSIPFSHIRGELHLFSKQLATEYTRLFAESTNADLPAEICLVFGNNPQAELAEFLMLYRQQPIPVKRFIIFSGNDKVAANSLLLMVIPGIRREFPGIPAGTGTNCNFAQLNRSRPDFKDIDFVTFAVHPQEHSSDERTMVENVAAQQYVIESALKSDIQKPVIVSPVTLQRRFNANLDNFELPAEGNIMPIGVDCRQMSLFGSAWTVGSLKYLLDSGVTSLTYFETVGERGLFMGEYGSRWPEEFAADQGMIFPVFHLFRILLNNGRFRVPGSYSTNSLVIDGFTVAGESTGLAFISNMTRQKQKFSLTGTGKCRIILKMNAGNFNKLSGTIQFSKPGEKGSMTANTGKHMLQPYETLILEYRL